MLFYGTSDYSKALLTEYVFKVSDVNDIEFFAKGGSVENLGMSTPTEGSEIFLSITSYKVSWESSA